MEKWPKATEILKKVNFTNPQIAAAAAMVDVDGMTPEDAAKKWIADNRGDVEGLGSVSGRHICRSTDAGKDTPRPLSLALLESCPR